MPQSIHILWIDDYNLGDPLFLQSLGRSLAAVPDAERHAIIIHGAAEKTERMLEARGIEVRREDGVLVPRDPSHLDLIEQSFRDVNKHVTAIMTEFIVPAVGIQGSDRGLFRIGENGRISAGRTDWITSLTASGAVPVVSALAFAARPVEILVDTAVETLATCLAPHDVTVVLFTRDGAPGLVADGQHLPSAPARALESAGLADSLGTLKHLIEAEIPVHLTSPRYVFSSKSAFRTVIVP